MLPALTVAFALLLLLSATADAQSLEITTQPAIYPAFSSAAPDYVVRCNDGSYINVNVTAPAGMQVDVDGQGPRTGTFTTSVLLRDGQAFGINASSGPGAGSYYVRCLPSDLPRWTFQKVSEPQTEWFTAAPFAKTNFAPPPVGVSPNYTFIFDGNGVPVWWYKTIETPTDFLAFPNGNVATLRGGNDGGEERRLDGSLVRTMKAVGVHADPHELMLLPNGNYLITTLRTLNGYSFCGHTNVAILDNGVQEVSPSHNIVWDWWASDHIGLSEVSQRFCNAFDQAYNAYDPFHINSIEPEGNDVLLSFRHLDAAFSVHKSNGSVEWKIGGSTRPESLTVLNDPIFTSGGGFGGQHDVRVMPDGTITLHDNGFAPTQRPPRAPRYALNLSAKTATLVEEVNDPTTPTPICCGSSRKLSGGNWLMNWGSSGIITELTSAGSRVFKLTWDDGLFSYRSHPVPTGVLSRDAMRAGLDAQHPRAYARPKGAAVVRFPLVPAYRQCQAPDRQHGPALAFPSCSSPALTSNFLTVGADGSLTESIGHVIYRVTVGNPSTSANEADVALTVSLTDVRLQSNLSDYAGQLQVRGAVRITDQSNGPLRNESATGQDTEFPVPVQCASTASTSVGGTCSVSTTFNAVVPGTVVESQRARWQLGQLKVNDGGSTGVAGASNATLFTTQGVFVP